MYYFFFSYARDNDSPYLKQFFDDLSQAVREKSRLRGDERVGFFDQRDLDLGAQWDPELREALQTSRSLVCMYSPPYFQSENCGREWQVFKMRREQFVRNAEAAGDANARLPPVIKPVIWIPLREELPQVAQGPQYMSGDPNAEHNRRGLSILTKLSSSRFKDEYTVFIDELSTQILNAARHNLPRADLGAYPTFESVPNAFEPEPAVEAEPAPPADHPRPEIVITKQRAVGPNFVQFVFVAGSPSEFMAEALNKPDEAWRLRKAIEFYIENGGRDWKPYFPEVSKRIRPVVTRIASTQNLDSDELPCDDQMVTKIHQANTNRSLVVILVDSWTLDLPKYRAILESFDQNLYSNCSVLIPWNENDPELTPEQRERLKWNVRTTFRNWSTVPKPLYFCYSIRSADKLNEKIRETLKALRDSVIYDTVNNPEHEISRPVPSNIAKPSITSKPGEDVSGGSN